MRLIIFGALVAAFFLLLIATDDERQPCNAEGDVRYVGEQKYVCEQTSVDGLRWTWKLF